MYTPPQSESFMQWLNSLPQEQQDIVLRYVDIEPMDPDKSQQASLLIDKYAATFGHQARGVHWAATVKAERAKVLKHLPPKTITTSPASPSRNKAIVDDKVVIDVASAPATIPPKAKPKAKPQKATNVANTSYDVGGGLEK